MIKPLHIFLFLSALFLTSLGIAYVFPEEGIPLGEDTAIRFASLEEILQQEEDTVEAIDVVALLETYEEEFDSTAIKDSIRLAEIAYRKMIMRIQYPEGQKARLPIFFQSLKTLQSGRAVKIVHYGDSQIEGDRISAHLRNSLQKTFGGSGPGFVAIKSVVDKFSISKSISDNWSRYAAFGIRDSLLHHRKFGMYGSYSRFTPSLPDSVLFPQQTIIKIDTVISDVAPLDSAFADSLTQNALPVPDTLITMDTVIIEAVEPALDLTDTVRAWVEFRPSGIAFNTAKKYNRMRILLGNIKVPFQLKTLVNDSLVSTTSYFPGDDGVHEEFFTSSPDLIRLEFAGAYSPDIYGVLLENTSGIQLDNVAMRGSSGVYFTRINYAQFARQLNREPIKLILFQFGGNSVPYITSDRHEKWYEKNLKKQLKLLRELNPDTDIVVIGPSDMSVKVKTKYVTHPRLESVRDLVRRTAFEYGCGFWDTYEVMGGKNSMPAWVNATPRLGTTDYVHFTPKGAAKVGRLFFDALFKDYQDAQKNNTNGSTDEAP